MNAIIALFFCNRDHYSCSPTDDELRPDRVGFRLRRVTVDPRKFAIQKHTYRPINGVKNSRQIEDWPGGHGDIVIPDDGNIVRHGQIHDCGDCALLDDRPVVGNQNLIFPA